LILLLLWIVLAFVVAFGARNRGRSGVIWFILAILFSPILVGIILLILGERR
jgi:hypothetical protein